MVVVILVVAAVVAVVVVVVVAVAVALDGLVAVVIAAAAAVVVVVAAAAAAAAAASPSPLVFSPTARSNIDPNSVETACVNQSATRILPLATVPPLGGAPCKALVLVRTVPPLPAHWSAGQ